jgi:hypothetical protein
MKDFGLGNFEIPHKPSNTPTISFNGFFSGVME